MFSNESMAWLREAVGGIKYPPDRKKVERELYAHMADRNRDFLEAGCSEREADEKVLAAMGAPVTVRRKLAAVHRPFWGYALLALRILGVCFLIWTLVSCVHNRGLLKQLAEPLADESRYEISQWIPQSSRVRCGAYTFRLKRAAWARSTETGESLLLLDLGISTPDPLLGPPVFYAPLLLEDDRGLRRSAELKAGRDLVFTSRRLWAVELEPGAEWAVLTIEGPDVPERLIVRLEGGWA